jgi:hypothetical protein
MGAARSKSALMDQLHSLIINSTTCYWFRNLSNCLGKLLGSLGKEICISLQISGYKSQEATSTHKEWHFNQARVSSKDQKPSRPTGCLWVTDECRRYNYLYT